MSALREIVVSCVTWYQALEVPSSSNRKLIVPFKVAFEPFHTSANGNEAREYPWSPASLHTRPGPKM
jgi:hypothetical protein